MRNPLMSSIVGAVSILVTLSAEADKAKIHQPWDRLLRSYVTDDGWVAYEKLGRERAADLNEYLKALASSDPSGSSKEDAMAFWINAYNALCIRTLMDEKLPRTVPHRSVLGIGTNIFQKRKYEIGGKIRSLDEIEHKILRRRYGDNRVHAALVCGASSCPRLRPEAYEGGRLSLQLDEECRRWISSGLDKSGKRKNYLDRSKKRFHASRIFDWFKEDFGGNRKGILEFIAKYSDPEDRDFMLENEISITYLEYDWSLNRSVEKD